MMKRVILLLLVGVGVSGLIANTVDLSAPAVELGSAGSKGHLEIWKEVPEVGLQLGGSYLPFRYKFTTDPSVRGVLGVGFFAPMLEAHSVLIRPRVMRAGLPCGKTIYLWQHGTDQSKYQSVDKEWNGEVKGGDFSFRRSDGWEISYHQGRLSSIVTDDHHTFSWQYNGSLLTSILQDGLRVITIGSESDGKLSTLTAHNKNYQVTYGKRPIPEVIQGTVAIKNEVSVLSKISGPGEAGEEFLFKISPQSKPTLTLKDSSGQESTYTWNPANGILMSEEGPEGKWSYQVGKVTQEFGLPPLSRTSSDGQTESVSLDRKQGIYTVQEGDGVKRVTQVFTAPGPLYHKVKKVEETKDGVQKTSLKASYDETGRLIRKIDDQGNITTYNYNQKGNLVGKTHSLTQEKQDQIAVKEKEMLKALESAPTPADRQDQAFKLGLFYIHEMRDPSKALALLPQINQIYHYAIRVQSIDNNEKLTPIQKVAGYQELLKEYPKKEEDLKFLINIRTQELDDENN